MTKKELTKLEHNDSVWLKIKELEEKINTLKGTLHPAELPKQASLNDCNVLARKAKATKTKTNPKLLAAENV